MIAVSFSRTMANAKRIVQDTEISLRKPFRRENVVAIAREWNLAREARQQQERVAEEQIIQMQLAALERARVEHPIQAQKNDEITRRKSLIAQVAAWHEVSVADIMGLSHRRHHVAARFDAMAAIYLNCRIDGRRYSLNELGRVFKRDHTTTLSALKKRGLR